MLRANAALDVTNPFIYSRLNQASVTLIESTAGLESGKKLFVCTEREQPGHYNVQMEVPVPYMAVAKDLKV